MKNKFILITISFLLFILSQNNLLGQSKEVGLRMSSFNNFGFIFKNKKAENKYFRFGLGATSLDLGKLNGNNNVGKVRRLNLDFNISLGLEKRIPITENLFLVHGINPQLRYSIQATNSTFTTINDGDGSYQMSISPRFGYILGFQLNLKKNFYINIETIPYLSATFNKQSNEEEFEYFINLDLNSNAISLSLVYCFEKKKGG